MVLRRDLVREIEREIELNRVCVVVEDWLFCEIFGFGWVWWSFRVVCLFVLGFFKDGVFGVFWRWDELEIWLGFGNFSRVEEGNVDFGVMVLMKLSKCKWCLKFLSWELIICGIGCWEGWEKKKKKKKKCILCVFGWV